MKRKHLSPGRFLVLLNMAWFAIFALLLFANDWQFKDRLQKAGTIDTIKHELRWKSHVTDRALAQALEIPELQFLTRAMETKDRNLYAIAKAAWKYGRALEKWDQVRNGPALVMSVVHRESNFDPLARSYRIKRDKDGNIVLDKNGEPVKIAVAYGAMQINYGVWKDDLKLDLARMNEPDYNVRHAVDILDGYLKKNGGDISSALFDYWGGSLAGGSYTYPPRVLESKYFDAHPTLGGFK